MATRNVAIPTLALLASLSSGFSSSVMAGGPNYNFIEARYLLDAELENVDGDGLRFDGSYRFTRQVFGFAEFDSVDLDNYDADLDVLKLGAGYIHPINASMDFNLSLAYVDAEVDARGANYDDSGFEISGGIRTMIQPNIELRANANYIDIEDDDTYFTLGGDYFFMSNFSAGLEIDLGADYETLSIGARYSF
ncbi:MAG: hypothetical protein P8103_01150 [Candidatus Thiodiazotropha sp.]